MPINIIVVRGPRAPPCLLSKQRAGTGSRPYNVCKYSKIKVNQKRRLTSPAPTMFANIGWEENEQNPTKITLN